MARRVTLSVPSASVVTKKSRAIAPSEDQKQKKFLTVASRSKSTNSKKEISQRLAHSVSVFKNTRSRHQIRPRHRYLWYGLLRCNEATRFLHLPATSTTGQNWSPAPTHRS